jgi:molybdenum cofactor cytidylyltransferase
MSSGLCGVILAAGESTRMGRDKALLPWPLVSAQAAKGGTTFQPSPGGTLLSAAIRALSPYSDMVIVVAGKNADALALVIYAEGGYLVRNSQPERGQFSSLQTGLAEVLNQGRDSAMVTLVDRPPPRPETLQTLVEAFERRAHSVWAVVPEYEGKHGHPILIGREMMGAFLTAPPTATAREVEHANQQHICYIGTNDNLVVANFDTPQDYSSSEPGHTGVKATVE